MRAPDGGLPQLLASNSCFHVLGGERSAADPWTTIDFSWLHAGASAARDVVGYRALPMALRTSGLTIRHRDAAPLGAPFLIQILDDRLVAQAWWEHASLTPSQVIPCDMVALQAWTAGSLSANLRVLRGGAGEVGLEAMLHLAASTPSAALREFVTAFSWDVSALHATVCGAPLCPTEELVHRGEFALARASPAIPLRADSDHAGWQLSASPRGLFCSLLPGGALAEIDSVLYALRGVDGALVPLATMPGHRRDWDCARLVDVRLARDGVACMARSLVGKGFIRTSAGRWQRIIDDCITALAPWGHDGFLLGLYDGRVAIVDGACAVSTRWRIARVEGRFRALASAGDRAVGLVGSTLVSARLPAVTASRRTGAEQWSLDLEPLVTCDMVCELDADTWSTAPRLAVLGDDALLIVHGATGVVQQRLQVANARLAQWIGPDALMVLANVEAGDTVRSQLLLLDTATGQWTTAFETAEVSRIAVRDDEIHVGYANQSIAIWDREWVARAAGQRGAA